MLTVARKVSPVLGIKAEDVDAILRHDAVARRLAIVLVAEIEDNEKLKSLLLLERGRNLGALARLLS